MKNEHTIEIKFEKDWTDAIDKAFKKVAKDIEIDGFRKGAVPKDMFIKKYGVESLYEEAINILIADNQEKLMGDAKIKSVIRPVVDVKDISDKEITISVKKITEPVVKLGEYKDLKIKKDSVNVAKKDVDEKIESLQSEHADFVIVDKAVENKDIAVIDFSGVVDGEILEGGTGFDYSLEIGSNSFIPGFEEKLIGAKTGEERVINLKFPEDYHADCKGKDVEFTVTIKEVKTKKLPVINEEFFEDLGIEVKTEEEFRKEVETNLIADKEAEADKKFMDEVFDKGIKSMELEINSEIIEDETEKMYMEAEETLTSQGMNMEMYMQMIGMDEKAIRESMSATAKSRLEVKYFLKAVAAAEKLKVTKKELDAKIKEYCEYSGEDEKEAENNEGLREYIESVLLMEVTAKFLKENN